MIRCNRFWVHSVSVCKPARVRVEWPSESAKAVAFIQEHVLINESIASRGYLRLASQQPDIAIEHLVTSPESRSSYVKIFVSSARRGSDAVKIKIEKAV